MCVYVNVINGLCDGGYLIASHRHHIQTQRSYAGRHTHGIEPTTRAWYAYQYVDSLLPPFNVLTYGCCHTYPQAYAYKSMTYVMHNYAYNVYYDKLSINRQPNT